MSKRTIILVAIAIGVWGAALYFLFFYGKENKATVPQKPIVSQTRIKVTPKVVEEYITLIKESFSDKDFFSPIKIERSFEEINRMIMEGINQIPDIHFHGYIIFGGKRYVFLEKGGTMMVKTERELIDGRYMILHLSSLGIVVLDIERGGLFTIR